MLEAALIAPLALSFDEIEAIPKAAVIFISAVVLAVKEVALVAESALPLFEQPAQFLLLVIRLASIGNVDVGCGE